MRVSELLGRRLVSESGQKLGHVFDVRVKRDPRSSGARADQKWKLDALVFGRRGVIDRFGVITARHLIADERGEAVPWTEVVDIGPEEIVVRDRSAGAEAPSRA